jgi:Matrixin
MTWRPLALVVVVMLAMLTSCSSAKAREQHPAAPVSQPSGAPTDACVAPAGLALQDQDRNDHQVPWKRNGVAKVVITFETKNVPPDWVAEMQKGVAAWNKSPCLDTKLVQTCQPKTNCVTVSVVPESAMGSDGNFDAVESGGFTVRGHIEYSNSLTDGAKTNVAIHEMGHAVGLAHRKTEHVLMNGDTYDDVFDPDQIDFENLLVLYGNQK